MPKTYAIGHLREVQLGDDIAEYLRRIDDTFEPYGGRWCPASENRRRPAGASPRLDGRRRPREYHQYEPARRRSPATTMHRAGRGELPTHDTSCSYRVSTVRCIGRLTTNPSRSYRSFAPFSFLTCRNGRTPSPNSRAISATISTRASPRPRNAGSVQTALISVWPGIRIRSPAIATSRPCSRTPT